MKKISGRNSAQADNGLPKLKTSADIADALKACQRQARTGNKADAAAALIQIALTLHDNKKSADESRRAYIDASKLFVAVGNLESAGSALLSAGLIAKRQKQMSTARKNFSDAGALFERASDSTTDQMHQPDVLRLAIVAWRHAAMSAPRRDNG